MDSNEFAQLERLDRDHWFYRGKRAIVGFWLRRFLRLQPDDLLLDAGAGTGTWLVEMSRQCRVLGLDSYDESIALARPKLEAVGGQVLQTELAVVALPDRTATVVTLLDVLEHLDDDLAALREMIRLTKPGGLIVITVPALRWIWSDWDVKLHHRRRYHHRDFLALVSQPEVEVLRCAYFNSLLLPAIFAVRMWRKFSPPAPDAVRAEDQLPSPWLNRLLFHLMVKPACTAWFRPPAGVSLIAVLRKRHMDRP